MRTRIKEILREDINKGPLKLSVFDFDGTLVDTGEKDLSADRPSAAQYKAKTGEDWPFGGWWGRKESLDTDVFDFKSLNAKSSYEDEFNKSDVLTIIATGRRDKLKTEVLNVLNKLGFIVNPKHLYCNDKSDTFTFKADKFSEILDANPSIREVELWDDRHITEFFEWGKGMVKKGNIESFKITDVTNGSVKTFTENDSTKN